MVENVVGRVGRKSECKQTNDLIKSIKEGRLKRLNVCDPAAVVGIDVGDDEVRLRKEGEEEKEKRSKREEMGGWVSSQCGCERGNPERLVG